MKLATMAIQCFTGKEEGNAKQKSTSLKTTMISRVWTETVLTYESLASVTPAHVWRPVLTHTGENDVFLW